jgi:hypothetical protein
MRTLLLLAALSAPMLAEEIVLGPETTVAKDATGRFLRITDGRAKTEYLINLDRVVMVTSSNPNDNNSYTEIRVGLGDSDKDATTLKIQQRIVPYEDIKKALQK